MNLFNRKTLKRHIKADPIPTDHLAALEAWAELISSGRIERLKETALHGQFASKIVEEVLGYRGPAGGADYNVSTEQNIREWANLGGHAAILWRKTVSLPSRTAALVTAMAFKQRPDRFTHPMPLILS